tara:strand:- start:2301 stop:2735 length:435 start_codon:yes stop_codon:yes gene_type:complete
MNDVAVAQALAARVLAVSGPAGYASVRNSYAFPPDAISATPSAIVISGTDQVEVGGQTRRTQVNFTVRIYVEPISDLARRMQLVGAYRTWVRNLYNGSVTLGGLVDQAAVVSTDVGAEEYAGIQYLTIEAQVECVKLEAVAYTA